MLGVSLPLLNILGGEGYATLLRQGGFDGVRVLRTPDRPASFVLSLTVPVRSAAAAELGGAADAAAARLAQSLAALLTSCHAEGHLLGAQLAVLDARTGAPLAELAVGHTSWHAPHAVHAGTRFNMAEVRAEGTHAHAHALTHARTEAGTHMHARAQARMRMHVHMRVHMRVHVHMCACTRASKASKLVVKQGYGEG